MSIVYWVEIDELGAMDGWGNYTNNYGGGCILAKSHDRNGFYSKVHTKENGEVSANFANNSFSNPKFVIGNKTSNNLGEWIQVAFVIN